MYPIHIALCDDDPHWRGQTAALAEAWLRDRARAGSVTRFEDGQALIGAVQAGAAFDLYLLDVLMPGPDGIATAKALRRLEVTGEILYLTSTSDFAVDSYGVGAFFYLLKPVEKATLFDLLDRAAGRIELRHGTSVIVPTARGDRRVLLDDILYAEKVGRRVHYVCMGETVESRTLQTAFKQAIGPLVADRRFCPCGASYVINLQRVCMVDGRTACFTGGRRLILPRTAHIGFKHLWGEYWLKEGR